MTTRVLQPSTVQLAGISTTQLSGFNAAQMSVMTTVIADMASVQQGVVDDQQIIKSQLGVPSAATLQPGIIFTGDTVVATATITSFVVTSPSGAVIGQIRPGMKITGPGIALGTTVLSAASTTITLDRNVITGYTGGTFVCVGPNLSGGLTNGLLTIPNRGVLKVLPGDVVMLDNYGFPYLVPATSIGASGSGAPWILV